MMRVVHVRELTLCVVAVLAAARPVPAEEPAAPTGPSDVAQQIPAELQDPAFTRYVDLALLGQAVAKHDSALLADVGLQLAEGERILLRSHKNLPADFVLQAAIKVAVANRDMATLDRLAEHAKRAGDKSLATRVAASRKLAGTARATDPALMLSVEKTTIEQFALFHDLDQAIKASRLLANAEQLKALEQQIYETDVLSSQQKKYLAQQIEAARKALPKSVHPTSKALAKLTALSRGRVFYRIRNGTNDTVYFSLHGSGRSYQLGPRRSQSYTNPQPPYILLFQRDGNPSRFNISTSGNYVIYEDGGRLIFGTD